jgi:hypothetical protein
MLEKHYNAKLTGNGPLNRPLFAGG